MLSLSVTHTGTVNVEETFNCTLGPWSKQLILVQTAQEAVHYLLLSVEELCNTIMWVLLTSHEPHNHMKSYTPSYSIWQWKVAAYSAQSGLHWHAKIGKFCSLIRYLKINHVTPL